jgi:peptidoglycan/xylan/chitin deacetylase (PgdA/CDA1 family)
MKMSQRNAYITTSWDDGHPLDFRLADLLAQYKLRATFYIPREASTGVMSESGIRALSKDFEIGAHTMNHVFLDTADAARASKEIRDSRKWVEDVTGKACPMFCPPGGKFDSSHLALIESAGFSAVRSVELFSLDQPRKCNGLQLMPTTLQAHPHRIGAYARNIAKRKAWKNLWLFILHGHSTDYEYLTHTLLDVVRRQGGVFHLWGHSWELEENGQWERLEAVLKLLGDASKEIPSRSNGELCLASSPALTAPSRSIPATN